MTNQVNIMPMIALRGTTVLPEMIVHFDVSREKSIRAVEAAMLHDQKVFLLTQKDPEVETPELDDLYRVGTIAYIKQVVKLPQDLYRVLVEGLDRAEILSLEQEEPYLKAECEIVTAQEEEYPEPVKDAMLRSIRELFQRYCRESGKISKDLVTQIMTIEDVKETIDQIAVNLPMSYQNKQKLLEAVSLNDRYEILGALLGSEIEVIHITKDLQRKVKSHIDKNQREYILREQLKTIREELGEDNTADDIEEFKKQLKELDASDEVKEKISKEISRFKGMAASAAEATVQRGYLETVLALPWNKKSEDSEDLENAWKVLEEGHYGLKDVKERIMEFLAVRKLTHKGKSPILCLVGPPGTGKTLLAKAVAGEAGVPFFSISGSDFVEMFVGVGASRVRDLFEDAKKNAPCIVFIDEIDAVARRRGTGMGGGHDEREQTLNQLLVEMDGFGVNEGIIVMAATNRVDILDPAIMRPGRFDRKVHVGRPDIGGREEILKVHAKNKPLAEDVDLKQIAQTTAGFTGADLENLLNEAAIVAAKENRSYIIQKDIKESFLKVGVGPEKKSRIITEKEKKITAYHESGHAILFHVLPDVGPVYTVSIIPTGGGAAGYTMPLLERDEMFDTKGRMLQQIIVSLGGRVAEELIFDDITTGASQDIKQATELAKAMVTKYGFSENVGLINYNNDDDEVFIGRDLAHTRGYGEGVASKIDEEVKRIIDECYAKARAIIQENSDVLHKSADLLLEKEKIGRDEFEALFQSGADVVTETTEE